MPLVTVRSRAGLGRREAKQAASRRRDKGGRHGESAVALGQDLVACWMWSVRKEDFKQSEAVGWETVTSCQVLQVRQP